MKKLSLPFFAIVLALPITQSASAVSGPQQKQVIEHYFNELAKEDINFEPEGAVCERIAAREVDTLYPAVNYTIVNGIQYDDKKSTIGELDLVIFDKSTGAVEAIAEVKCWKNFQGALKKAKAQRMRFQTFLDRDITLKDQNEKVYSKKAFANVKKFFTIAQSGGLNHGFDFELSLDLKDLLQLRKELLDCQVNGQCPKK